jgi:hypothetical protein
LKRKIQPSSKVVGGVVLAAITAVVVTWAVSIAGPPSGSPAPVVAVTSKTDSAPTTGPLTTNTGTPRADRPATTGPPLSVNLFHETYLDDPEITATVFPSKLNLAKEDLQRINAGGITSWLAGRNGYEGVTELKLTVTGRRPCRILNMRADVLSRTAPPKGTLFRAFAGGGVGSILFTFNLDSGSPVALVSTNDYLNPKAPAYFQTHTFTLASGEQHTFQIEALTSKYAVQWIIDITILDGKKIVHDVVRDGDGSPFRTSAVAGISPQEMSAYKAIYSVCGMLGPALFGSGPNVPQCKGKSNYYWVRAK